MISSKLGEIESGRERKVCVVDGILNQIKIIIKLDHI